MTFRNALILFSHKFWEGILSLSNTDVSLQIMIPNSYFIIGSNQDPETADHNSLKLPPSEQHNKIVPNFPALTIKRK